MIQTFKIAYKSFVINISSSITDPLLDYILSLLTDLVGLYLTSKNKNPQEWIWDVAYPGLDSIPKPQTNKQNKA